MAKPLKVVVWATGGIGSIAFRAIRRRPDLELVGVWDHSPEKAGRDAGFLGALDMRLTTPRHSFAKQA